MARQVLFVQGGGEDVHDRWDSKLVASLERELGEGYGVRYPRMPAEDDPTYAVWKTALTTELDLLDDGAILVAHSVGGTILIRLLAEQPAKPGIGGLFVIAAPFIGEGGWPSEDSGDRTDFRHFPQDIPVHLYHGGADDVVPVAHIHPYAQAIPHAVARIFEDRDHQLGNDMRDIARDIRCLG